MKILQLNFGLTVPATEYQQIVAPYANQFAAVPGLRWKIWLIDAEKHEAGGIYLFEDAASLTTFLQSPFAAALMAHPALSEFSAETFDIIPELTAITRGPVEEHVAA